MKNVDATFIDKTDQSDLTRREEYFRTKLRTKFHTDWILRSIFFSILSSNSLVLRRFKEVDIVYRIEFSVFDDDCYTR